MRLHSQFEQVREPAANGFSHVHNLALTHRRNDSGEVISLQRNETPDVPARRIRGGPAGVARWEQIARLEGSAWCG